MMHIQNFSQALKNVPEVHSALVWAKKHPEAFLHVAKIYICLVRRMVRLTKKDRILIHCANSKLIALHEMKTSASTITADVLMTQMTSTERSRLSSVVTQMLRARSDIYRNAIRRLSRMMEQGHKLFSHGDTPHDGDPKADQVIWGHTQMRKDVKPLVLIHFIFAHFISRYVGFALPTMPIFQEKDALLNALTDVVLLMEARRSGSSEVVDIWLPSRVKGGLQWITHKQLDEYRRALRVI